MIGIVIVSHSQRLAEGVVELAYQMADKQMKIIAVGGLEDGSIGTDTFRIMEAVKTAESGAGVLILVDLGSSVLSAQLAVDLLRQEDYEGRIVIVDAPLVEGAIVASVQASNGDSIDDVKELAAESYQMRKF